MNISGFGEESPSRARFKNSLISNKKNSVLLGLDQEDEQKDPHNES
jgi:hypothetical protein